MQRELQNNLFHKFNSPPLPRARSPGSSQWRDLHHPSFPSPWAFFSLLPTSIQIPSGLLWVIQCFLLTYWVFHLFWSDTQRCTWWGLHTHPQSTDLLNCAANGFFHLPLLQSFLLHCRSCCCLGTALPISVSPYIQKMRCSLIFWIMLQIAIIVSAEVFSFWNLRWICIQCNRITCIILPYKNPSPKPGSHTSSNYCQIWWCLACVHGCHRDNTIGRIFVLPHLKIKCCPMKSGHIVSIKDALIKCGEHVAQA